MAVRAMLALPAGHTLTKFGQCDSSLMIEGSLTLVHLANSDPHGFDRFEPQEAGGGANPYCFLFILKQRDQIRFQAGSLRTAIACAAAARTLQSVSPSAF